MGVRETLDLDITSALASVDRVEKALDDAAKSFVSSFKKATANLPPLGVDVDVAALKRDVERALNQVDTSSVGRDLSRDLNAAGVVIDVAVDQASIITQIRQAVNRANPSLTVTADASSVTGAINAAVARANQNVTINGNANVSGLQESSEGFTVLGGTVKAATAALGAYVGLEGIQRVVGAASDLQEAQTKIQAVFGASAAEALRFGDTSAQAIGQSKVVALDAIGTFGNFLTSSGLARDQALEFSTTLTELASDLASFNNIDPTEAILKLRSGLAGEIEPLRAIGISFTEAETQAKALELGLVNLGEEADQAAKLQARYALILEKSSNAQGDFARTSDGLANQQRILRAQFEDILTVVGAPLVSPLLSILQTAVPLAGEAAEAFGRIVGVILPALDALIQGALPAFEAAFVGVGDAAEDLGPALLDIGVTAGEILGAVTPLVEAFAALLGGLATGVSILTAFLREGENLAIGVTVLTTVLLAAAVASGTFSGAVGFAAIAVTALFSTIAANPVGALIAALGAAAVALGVLNDRANDGPTVFDRIEQSTDALKSSLLGTADTLDETVKAFTDGDRALGNYITTQSQFSDANINASLQEAGISVQRLTGFLRQGTQGYNDFVAAAIEGGEVTLKDTKLRDENGDAIRYTAEQIRAYEGNLSSLIASGQIEVEQGEQLVQAFNAEVIALQTIERQALTTAVANGQLSQAQLDAAVAWAEGEGAADVYGRALELIATKLPEINAGLDRTQVPLGQQAASWQALAKAIADGTVESEQYQQVADALGVDLETVTEFADGVTEAIQKIVENAVSKLPTASTALGKFQDEFLRVNQKIAEDLNKTARETAEALGQEYNPDIDVAVEDLESFQNLTATDVSNFIKSLQETGAEIDSFDNNLRAIRATSPEVADFLAEQGPEAAGKLAQALVNMPGLIAGVETELVNIKNQTAEFAQSIGQAAIDAPEEAAALAKGLTDAFGLNLDFTTATEEEIRETIKLLQDAIPGFETEGGAAGESWIRGWLAKLNPEVGVASGNAITAGINAALGINSPSKVAAETGVFYAQGFAVGLERTAALVAGVGSDLAAAAFPPPTPAAAAQAPTAASGVNVGGVTVQVTAAPGMTPAEAQTVGAQAGAAAADEMITRFRGAWGA